ncbi:MAG: GIY-YIG nuclease family protein [Thermoguttaceae bacterium]|jgi:hypothetical protein
MTTKQTTHSLGIVDLLKMRGFDATQPTKFVRHQDSKRYDVNDLMRSGWLDFYQATQGKPVFDHCKQIVSFIGAGGTKARFIGVYKVLGPKHDGRKYRPPKGYPRILSRYQYFYDLELQTGFEDLENRIVIDWGKNTINWHQWFNKKGKELNDKEVIELLPSGQTRDPFSDYLEFTLTHEELKQLYINEDANREWRARLAAVAGVYLILDTKKGKQYVGSAYGAKGIWGRWAAYARNGHGGNKLLHDLINKDSSYPEKFSYSILQILPKSFARCEVLEWEKHYKEKLGSRSAGLNIN